jgi:hypothetical protein
MLSHGVARLRDVSDLCSILRLAVFLCCSLVRRCFRLRSRRHLVTFLRGHALRTCFAAAEGISRGLTWVQLPKREVKNAANETQHAYGTKSSPESLSTRRALAANTKMLASMKTISMKAIEGSFAPKNSRLHPALSASCNHHHDMAAALSFVCFWWVR